MFGALLALSSDAFAVPNARFVYLRGKGTESCPPEVEVREAVQARLGYDPFSSYAPSTMFAEVAAVNGGFTANLKLVDGDNAVHGDRQLRVQGRCAELMDALALTISIAIDPMSVTRNGPPDDAPPAERSVDTSLAERGTADEPRPAEATSEKEPAAESGEPLVVSAGLGPIGSVGSAPSFAMGGVLFVDARRGHVLAGVEGRADLRASASAGPLGRVESSLLAGSLFAGLREGPFFAGPAFLIGRIAATSTDVAVSRDTNALFLAAGLRFGVGIALSERIEVRVRAEVLANLLRHELEISGRSAYEYPAVMADLSAGIAVRFW